MADYAISNVPRRVVYANSGVGPYAFTFEVLANTDIAVYRGSTLLTLTTDYSVTINANGTGSVTLVTAGTGNITIVGARAIQRTSDYTTGGDLFASTLNTDLDSQTIYVQQVAETAERGLKAPVTDPTDINMTLPSRASRAGKTLAFDANGNPVVGEDIGNWRGNWASGTAYTVRDLVKDASNYNVYRCNTAHTSSGSTPISSNADSAKWDLVVDAAYAAQQATAAAASASAAASSASAASSSASAASTSASNASSSASSASTSATNASNSATAAAGSASSASSSASSASTSATNAANSATSASNSASTATTQATNASNSASSASTSATNAANSASAASTSASNASTSATNAANSATSASNSASTATTQATNASNSATAAASSAVSAASSAASAAALLDNFDDRYLGPKSADPSVDNDGNALVVGALYFNTTDGVMKVYTASGWIAASSASVATLATFEFVATAGQTVFSGNDANGASLSYVAPALIVTLNGVRLRPGDDYTATNGTSITLVSAAALNDELVVDAFGSFLVANTVDLSTAQTIGGTKTFSNPITASAGTVSAPAITTTGDSNTGIFFPAADTIAFAEGGTEVVRINSAGDVQLRAAGTRLLNSSGNPILRQSGSVIQTQYVASGTRVTTTFTGWNEPSTAYRVSITPNATNSMIVLRYFVPAQVNSAPNVLQSFRAFRIVGGGSKDYALTSRGNTNGSRNPIAGLVVRPLNGWDLNDMIIFQVDVVDFPNTTSSVVYGFETNPEGANTTCFGFSGNDNSSWGFDADIVIVAQEIAQ